MEEKVNGIVIKSMPYLDYDSLTTIFTAEKGLLTAKLKGVKKATAKLKFAGEPFCFAEFIIIEKQGKRTIKTASLIDGFYELRNDYERFLCGSVVLDFCQKTQLVGEEYSKILLASVKALGDIAYGGNPFIALINFLLQALRTVGYALNVEECASCGVYIESRVFFDVNGGGFVCENCQKEDMVEVSKKTYELLQNAQNNPQYEVKYLKKALNFLDFYIYNKVGEKINSLKLLLKTVNF